MNINFGGRSIGSDSEPFIIAEMSGNHNGSLERAIALVDAIADSGAHAVKLQTYTADTMTLNLREGAFFISDPKSLWSGKSLYELYQEAHTPWEWHEKIFARAKEKGLLGFSTPFDPSAVEFLEKLKVPGFKVASFENTDLPLIAKIANLKKPMIISTGMANRSEIKDAVETVYRCGNQDLVLLKCTSSYPASPKDSNLNTIPEMRKIFGTQIGLSDHTLGIGAAIASVALGATVIEKHVTLKRSDGGVDSAFSLEPHELKALVLETKAAWEALGAVCLEPTEAEKRSLVFRRTLYFVQDLPAGKVISPDSIRAIRPGNGLSPKFTDQVLGKQLKVAVSRGTPVSWDLLT